MAIHSRQVFDAEAPAGFDGVFEWDYLTPAFQRATGRRIQPMDIDAHVEIGGHHLVIETKREGVPIPEGQRNALLQLWAKGFATVVFLWGKTEPIHAEVYYPSGRRSTIGEAKPARSEFTKKQIFDLCERWARWANNPKNKHPFQFNGEI
jgi:hypothetical protein